MAASSIFEIVFGSFVAVIFGLFSLYLIFEKQIKSAELYNKYKGIYDGNKLIVHHVSLIIGLLLMETLFFFYTPESFMINSLRVFLMVLFFLGIVLLVIQIFKFKQDRKHHRLG